MGQSPRMQNVNGSGKSYLDVVARKDTSSAAISSASKLAKKEQQELVKGILNAVKQEIVESDDYNRALDLKNADIILMRMATLLDEAKAKFVEEELTQVKDEILDKVSGLSLDTVFKNFLIGQITDLFDDDAKKQDIEDLKAFLVEVVSKDKGGESSDGSTGGREGASEGAEGSTYAQKGVETTEDEQVGDYQDSTVAQNFQNMQDAITKQLDMLNDNVKSITGLTVFSGFVGFAMKGITSLLSGVASVTGKIAKFSKSVTSKIFNISKTIGGGAIGLLVKSVKGIASGVSSAIGLAGKIGKGISTGFSKIGSGIKGIGSKVGGAIMHPFASIGNFFKRKKKDKTAEKRERMREKFMDFMMTMFEKLWNFIEPVLNKLKIFMLIALVPILTTAATVIAIIAGLVIAGILLYKFAMWIKDKAIQFWNYIVSGELLDDIISGLQKAWEWLLDFGSYLWGKFLDFGKWLFVELPVKFGKWIWGQLVSFGNWLYEKFIFPYAVKPVLWLRDKLTTFLAPIMQKLQPFIESAQNLFARLKSIWDNFKWDESKSFFENLKCLASIVKDAVLDWWNHSPFKAFYDQYLSPIVKELGELYQKIINIFGSWDSNKSFFENIKDIGSLVLSTFKEWWQGSTIKTYWDKFTGWLDGVKEKVMNWWNGTKLGQWVNGLRDKIEALKQKMAAIIMKIPFFGFVRPFGPAAGLPFKLSDEESKDYENIQKKQEKLDELKEKLANGDTKGFFGGDKSAEMRAEAAKLEQELNAAKKAKEQPSVAQQQVSNAMKPVSNINGMNSQTNLELQQAGEEMSTKAAAAEQATQDYRQQQAMIGSQSLSELHDMREEMRKGFKDPAVVPLPMPYGPQRNSAMMESN